MNMRKRIEQSLWSVFTAVVLCGMAHAQEEEPFGISARLEGSDETSLVLTVTLTIAKHHHVYAERTSIQASEGVTLTPKSAPKPVEIDDTFTGEKAEVYEAPVNNFVYTVKRTPGAPFSVTVRYQGCSESLCFMPASETIELGQTTEAPAPVSASEPQPTAPSPSGFADLEIAGRADGYLPADKFIAFLDQVESGQETASGDTLMATFLDKGIWVVLVLILLGGLALNLTPCILPMIPINLAIIGAGAQAGSKRRGFALGATYGIGITLVYGVLGLVVVLTGSKFGTLNSSPWFNFGVAAVFVLLSLAMFDVITIDFSRFQGNTGGGKSKFGPFPAALIFGGLAALLAGACVAPVVISVLLLSADIYNRGSVAGLLLPFVLGLGMALPWPIAGAGLSFLPKPGKWMERVKYVFGVVIVLFALWYARTGIHIMQARGHQANTEGWHTELAPAIAEARATGKPIFADFWASWCKNCLQMEKTTFKDADVRKRLDSYVRLKFQAEDIGAPDTKAALDAIGAVGLPAYAILEVPGM